MGGVQLTSAIVEDCRQVFAHIRCSWTQLHRHRLRQGLKESAALTLSKVLGVLGYLGCMAWLVQDEISGLVTVRAADLTADILGFNLYFGFGNSAPLAHWRAYHVRML
eukprot:4979821-Amphidinium_carterae.1